MADENAALLNAYREHDRMVRLRYSKAACILVITLVPAGASLDYFVYPSLWPTFLVARLLVAGLVLVIFGLHYGAFGARHIRTLGMIPVLLTSIAICWMIYMAGDSSAPYYAGLNLVLLAVAVLLPWTLLEATIVVGITLTLYLLATLSSSTPPWSTLYNNVYFLVLTAIISCTSAFMKSRARLAEFKLQAELSRTNAELTRMERLKSQFFANISHELRTPLTLILSPIEDILRKLQNAGAQIPEVRKLAELLQIAHRNSLRLLKLINELLEFVRLDAAKVSRRNESIEFGEFLRGQAESVEHLAELQGLELETRTASTPVWVNADRGHLEKIVTNLLTNAIKYTQRGGKVRLELRHTEGYALVEVQDTGVGISPSDLKIIFDRFRQAENSPRAGAGGMGLGLALARELAQENDGRLTATSELGRGTTLLLELPLIEAPPMPAITAAETVDPVSRFSRKAERDYLHPAQAAAGHQAATFAATENGVAASSEPRVLVVDDEPDMRSYIVSALESKYRVFQADSGRAALEQIDRVPPELVVLDLMMPEMSGAEVCRRLNERPKTERPRVLMLTAHHGDEAKLDALGHGADDFLTKPFSLPELTLRIDNLLQFRALEQNLRRQNEQLEAAFKQLKDAELRLIESEKFSALGRMAGGLLHELNNPLNYAMAAATLAGENARGDAMLKEMMDDVKEALSRVQAVIGEVRNYANPGAVTRQEKVRLLDAVKRAVTLQQDLSGIKMELDVPENVAVTGAEVQLVQVLSNMLTNAVDAIRTSNVGSAVRIWARMDGDRVRVEVSDDGPGISPEVSNNVLEPFVTTKAPGEGTGLGLAICDRFVRNHGGKIHIASQPNAGTVLSFDLPVWREGAPATAEFDA